MADRPNLFCRHCNFPLTELGEPAPDSLVACPRCGAAEPFASLAKTEAHVSRNSLVGQFRDLLHRRK